MAERSDAIKNADWVTVPLAVPIDVMVHEYRMAKKPKEMLDILADQNGTRSTRIAWIMRRCGLDVDSVKLPRMKGPNSFDYDAFWSGSADAVVCDRIRQQMGRMNEVEEMENELPKELAYKEVPPEVSCGNSMSCEATLPEEAQENGCVEEQKRLRYIKPEKGSEPEEVKPNPVVRIPGRDPAEVDDHGIYRIVGELWSIYLDKLRERGVYLLGSVEVLKMQDMERIVHELVEGM